MVSLSTWNMDYWKHKSSFRESCAYYLEGVDSDIKIFQETLPDYTVFKKDSLVWHAIGDKRTWGSGIYCEKYPIREFPFKTALYGSVVAAEIEIRPDYSLIVISLYGIMEYVNGRIYSMTNLHRIFSDLTGILEGSETKKRIVIAGDFNASLQFDDRQPVRSHRVFFDRFKAWGLHNCFEGYYANFIQTYRNGGSSVPWQSTYIFISDFLVPLLRSCVVIENEKVVSKSDHNIVHIELDF
jgi:exonuclease III